LFSDAGAVWRNGFAIHNGQPGHVVEAWLDSPDDRRADTADQRAGDVDLARGLVVGGAGTFSSGAGRAFGWRHGLTGRRNGR
jgi:hypothetical protein